jgi:tripartite-type tricarboxylate transporter receptor subunit TctC
MRRLFLKTALAGVLFVAAHPSALAQNPDAEFFRGKTVNYIVATGPGGGYDTYGRLLTRYMAKYMPGTTFVVRNIPGAGNIIGVNTIYRARPDGLTFGIFNTGLIYSQMLKLPGVQFDLSKMSWIGKMADEGRTLVLATNSGLDSIEDLINAKEPVFLASSGVGAASDIETRLLQKMLGLNVRLITNIVGGETQLSMLRGEVSGVLEAASSEAEFVKQGNAKYVLSIAGAQSAVPGVPTARDFVTNEEHLRLITLVENIAQLGRPTAGPPGIPAGRLEVLRDAFMKAVNDPELRAQAARMNIPIQPARGDEAAKLLPAILAQPPNVVALLSEAAKGQ